MNTVVMSARDLSIISVSTHIEEGEPVVSVVARENITQNQFNLMIRGYELCHMISPAIQWGADTSFWIGG